jgi:hypothetical protein
MAKPGITKECDVYVTGFAEESDVPANTRGLSKGYGKGSVWGRK